MDMSFVWIEVRPGVSNLGVNKNFSAE